MLGTLLRAAALMLVFLLLAALLLLVSAADSRSQRIPVVPYEPAVEGAACVDKLARSVLFLYTDGPPMCFTALKELKDGAECQEGERKVLFRAPHARTPRGYLFVIQACWTDECGLCSGYSPQLGKVNYRQEATAESP